MHTKVMTWLSIAAVGTVALKNAHLAHVGKNRSGWE
jgi:hypothetical protein